MRLESSISTSNSLRAISPPARALRTCSTHSSGRGAPILLKCSGGQDRTSLAAALYLLQRDGPKALAQAEAQFAFWPYLHRPKHYQRWLKEFPAYAVGQARGSPLSVWVRERYDPKAFAAFLVAKGLAKSFRAFQAEGPR